MLLVALTGGIATGKTYVRERIASLGIPTIDADRVVHELMEPGQPTARAVAARFGGAFLRPDGSVDRVSLGRLVFVDAAARSDLEAIVHPRVYEEIGRWAEAQRQRGARWILADVPLLFETGRSRDFDLVVVTACAPALQLERLRDRGLGADEAIARLGAQWPTEDKIRRADFVVTTDGRFEETDRQVAHVVSAIEDRLSASSGSRRSRRDQP